MRPVKLAAAAVAIVAAIVAAPTPMSYASPPGSLLEKEIAVLTAQGIPRGRAVQAIDVQNKVAQANLPAKLQAGMGSSFAGIWFDNPAARLRVGVTSARGRHAAEAVLAREGLSDLATITPVRSTMAALVSAQQRLNRQLQGLFVREQVETGLEPQRNTVAVRLSASVSARERAAVERAATATGVNVLVTSVASENLTVVSQAKTECNEFVRNAANCDKSITSGVSIESRLKCVKLIEEMKGPQFFKTEKECLENEGGGEGQWERKLAVCTAGPIGIPLANKRERVLLTAGHCIAGGGGVGVEWLAFNRKKEEGVIGKAREFFNGGAEGEKKSDFGDIPIEPAPAGAWQTGKANVPVFAVTAEWKKMQEKEEETSYPVKGERLAVVNNTNCHEGQTSGESCGEIKMLNVAFVEKGKFIEGLVEDVGENLLGEGGDSGGPWLFVELNQEALMEGSHVGFVPECVKREKVEEGPRFFETQAKCASLEFEKKAGNKGIWERKDYECVKVGEVKEGAKFFETEAECKNGEKAGKGEWERKPALHLVYAPLKRPVVGAPEGSLEKLKLELLTTANEVLSGGWDVGGSLLAGTAALLANALVLAHGELVAGSTKIVCTGESIGITAGELVAPDELRAKDLTFTKCTANAPCALASETILTLPIHGLATLDGILNALVAVLPLPSKTFAVLQFEGETCALKGTQPLTGTINFLIDAGTDPAVSHLVLVTALLGGPLGGLKLGSIEATLTGLDADLRLESGQTWNFL